MQYNYMSGIFHNNLLLFSECTFIILDKEVYWETRDEVGKQNIITKLF